MARLIGYGSPALAGKSARPCDQTDDYVIQVPYQAEGGGRLGLTHNLTLHVKGEYQEHVITAAGVIMQSEAIIAKQDELAGLRDQANQQLRELQQARAALLKVRSFSTYRAAAPQCLTCDICKQGNQLLCRWTYGRNGAVQS